MGMTLMTPWSQAAACDRIQYSTTAMGKEIVPGTLPNYWNLLNLNSLLTSAGVFKLLQMELSNYKAM